MRRIWVVENAIPLQVLSYRPPFVENIGIRYLLNNHGGGWEEPEVKALCESLCSDAYELTVVTSPDQMLKHLTSGVLPPHAVVFDWEGVGFGNELNRTAIAQLLESSFTYVQVYTHVGAATVDPHLEDLRGRYPQRLLPTRAKNEVNPEELGKYVTEAWVGTMAGETADQVRIRTRAAVERMLIDLCSVRRSALAAMVKGDSSAFLAVVMAKLRDEIGSQGIDHISEVVKGGGTAAADDDLRRLQSVFYYHFPADDLVRTGDIVAMKGADKFGVVVTPQCHLDKFKKKTGGRLTIVDAEELTVAKMKSAGFVLGGVGESPTASHPGAGYSVVILPNVPKVPNDRQALVDLALMTHSWNTVVMTDAGDGSLKYGCVTEWVRLCTVTESFCGPIMSHLAATIGSAGVPDFPKFEIARLQGLLSVKP